MSVLLDFRPWFEEFSEKYILKYVTSSEDADRYAGRLVLQFRKEVLVRYHVKTEFEEGILTLEGEHAQEAKEWIEVQLEAENLNLFY